MLHLFGGDTRAAEAPRHLLGLPSRKEMLIAGIVLVTAAALVLSGRIAYSALTNRGNTTPVVPAVSQPVAQPVQQVPQQNVAVAPAIPLIEVRWVSIGRTRNGNEVLALPIPKRDPNSMGDGVASIGRDPTDGKYWFTPDEGVHKYKLANEPPAQFTTGFGSEGDVGTHGAFLEGQAVVLFMYTQVEPWVYEHWQAEIPLSQLKSLP